MLAVAGCIGLGDDANPSGALLDSPLAPVADDYYDVVPKDETYLQHGVEYAAAGATGDSEFGFHSFEEVEAKLHAWNDTYPHLVDLSVAGESVEGRPIYHVIVTDESVPTDDKVAPFFEGGVHGNEYGGSEIMLYTVDLLLQNHATNESVQELLRTIDLHVMPVVNPDGYVAGKRANANGVNLNRNFDVDWGNPLGTSNSVMGQLGAAAGVPFGGVIIVAENCGAAPNSEPETQAVAAVMESLGERAALHLAGHTPFNAILTIPIAFDPPFTVPAQHEAVLDDVLDWVRDNTEYEAGRAGWGDMSAGGPYAASGNSMDYWYAMHQKPGFTLEVEYWFTSTTSDDYPARFAEDYDGLRFWMDATLPITMHLLTNAQALANWEEPTAEPLMPAGWVQQPLPQRDGPPHYRH